MITSLLHRLRRSLILYRRVLTECDEWWTAHATQDIDPFTVFVVLLGYELQKPCLSARRTLAETQGSSLLKVRVTRLERFRFRRMLWHQLCRSSSRVTGPRLSSDCPTEELALSYLHLVLEFWVTTWRHTILE